MKSCLKNTIITLEGVEFAAREQAAGVEQLSGLGQHRLALKGGSSLHR